MPVITPPKEHGSVAETQGIRVSVTPHFLVDQSEPADRKYTFGYTIRITNTGTESAQVLSRAWKIVDAHGQASEVHGDGVVGKQPKLAPGQSFDYSSFCPLRTPWGTMEGRYTLRRDSGELFDALIGRFYLVCPEELRR